MSRRSLLPLCITVALVIAAHVFAQPGNLTQPGGGTILLNPDGRTWHPGQLVRFAPPSSDADSWSLRIRDADGPARLRREWQLEPAEIPADPRSHSPTTSSGFLIPQLPKGLYTAYWRRGKEGVRHATFTIVPRLYVDCADHLDFGRAHDVNVVVLGPKERPPRADLPAHSDLISPVAPKPPLTSIMLVSISNPSMIHLADGASATIATDEHGTAEFRMSVTGTGSATLTFSAPGFDPVEKDVYSYPDQIRVPPNGPDQAPIIYVHGFKDDGVPWARGTVHEAESLVYPISTRYLAYYDFGPQRSPAKLLRDNGLENWAVQWWIPGREHAPPQTSAEDGQAFLVEPEILRQGGDWVRGRWQQHNYPIPSALDVLLCDDWDLELLDVFNLASLVPFGKEITKVAIASQLPMRENYNNCGLAEHKAVDLLEMLQRERQYGRLSGCRQVNLITHSHGSLVTRAMLDLARRESREDAELAANVIYNAPPFGGSTLAHFDTLFLVNDELSADVFDDVLLNKAFAHTSNTLGGMLRLYTDRLVRAFGITGDVVFGALPEPILDALAELDEDYPTQFDGIDVLADELRPAGEAFTGVVKLIRPVITHLTGLPGSPAAEQDLSFEGGLAHLTRYETSPYVKQFVTLGRGGFDAWTFPNLSDVAANPQALINPARHLVGEDDDAVPAGSARLLTQTDAFGPRMTLLGEFATFSHGDLIYGRAVNIGDSGGIGTLWLETLLAAPTSLLLTGEVEFADDATRHYVVASAAAFSFSSEAVSARDVEVSATGHEYRVLTGARGQAIPKPWTPVDLGEQVFFGDLCAEQDLVPGVTFELEWRSVNARGGYEIIRSASITVSGDAPVLLPPSGPGVIATRAFSKVRNDRQTMRSTSGLTGAADLANTAVGEPDLIVRTQALDTLRMPAIKARDVTARWEVGIQQSIQARIELPRIAMPKNLSEGIHTLHLELDAGTDDSGKAENRSARVLRVRVDNTPPRVSLEGVPTLAPRDERQPAVVGPNTPLSLLAFDDGCGSARGQVTAGRANDPFPIGTVFTPRDILGSDKHTHGSADRDWDLTLTAAVQDPVGNAAQHRVQIRVDATPPRIEAVNIQGGKPRAESIVVSETRVAVDFRASDQLAGVDRAEVCVIKPHQGLAPPTRCRTLREPERFGTTVELDPGRNILLICAYDLVGNATTKLIVLDCNAEEAPRTDPPGWFKDVRSQVRGGRGVLSITLTRPAPRTGLTLLLISSHPAVVSVPELFPVPAEATTIRVPFLVRDGTKMAGMRITLQIDNSEYSVDIGASGGEDR